MDENYIHNGLARMTKLIINKYNDSSVHMITDSFVYNDQTYIALTNDEFSKLSENDYNIRLSSFIQYVYGLHQGLYNDCPNLTIGSSVYDITSCPLPLNPSRYEWLEID